jgi:hypothetical protein
MRRSVARDTIVIATVVPAQVIAWAADAARWHDRANRLRDWCAGVPIVAYGVTTVLWVVVVWRGALYPAFGGARNLRASWGGPTLAGAWAVHFAIAAGALLVASLALAWLRKTRARQRN